MCLNASCVRHVARASNLRHFAVGWLLNLMTTRSDFWGLEVAWRSDYSGAAKDRRFD